MLQHCHADLSAGFPFLKIQDFRSESALVFHCRINTQPEKENGWRKTAPSPCLRRGRIDPGFVFPINQQEQTMSNYPTTDFQGDCGESTQQGKPNSVGSDKGLQCNEAASIQGNTDLSTCMRANGGAVVYGITLTGSPGIYDFVVNVDAQGPHGFGSGSMYLAFTDESGDTYYLSIYSSTRSVHTVRYNSEKPAIKRIWWSDYSFSV